MHGWSGRRVILFVPMPRENDTVRCPSVGEAVAVNVAALACQADQLHVMVTISEAESQGENVARSSSCLVGRQSRLCVSPVQIEITTQQLRYSKPKPPLSRTGRWTPGSLSYLPRM